MSEVALIDCLGFDKFKEGHSYNFITGGDVDALSYLKLVLRHQPILHHCIATTWCMAAEDILQIQQWVDAGKIKRLDIYVGEIFPTSYKIEWQMLKNYYSEHPEVGRVAVFRNHSKIFAGYGDDFYFGIQTSANINTNPRTENGNITISKELYEFYAEYFNGIKSFENGT